MVLAIVNVVIQVAQPFVNYFGYRWIGLTYEWGMNDWAFYLDLWGALSPFSVLMAFVHGGVGVVFYLYANNMENFSL